MKKITKSVMRNVFLVLIISLAAWKGAFAQTSPIDESLKALERAQPTKAVKIMSEEAQKNPTGINLFYFGYVQLKAGNNAGALKSFSRGLELDEKDALNYAGKGYLQAIENNATEAKTLLDKALSLSKSKNSEVLKVVAEAYMVNPKSAGEAVKLLEKAIAIDNTDADAHILLGDAFLLQNNGGMSASSYEKAAKQDPKNAAPHYKLGLLYLRSRNTTVALEELKKAVELDPNYTLAHKELGEYYYLTKQGPEAVKSQEAYMKLMENPEQEEFRLAFYLFMAKDYKRANAIFDKLLQKPDVTSKTIRFAARSRIESGDTLGSSKVFEQFFVKAKPEEIDGADYAYYANMLKGLKKDSLAAISFEKSIALEPDPVIIEQLAAMYFKNKKYADAVRTYELLLTKRVKITSKDYYKIGQVYYLNQQYAEADTAFTKLTEAQPNMAVSYRWLGRAKSALDPDSKQGLAKPAYEKVIEKANPEKEKTFLIEAYHYLGSYYVQKDDIKTAKPYFEKILVLDPTNKMAQEAIKAIKEALSGSSNKPNPNQR